MLLITASAITVVRGEFQIEKLVFATFFAP